MKSFFTSRRGKGIPTSIFLLLFALASPDVLAVDSAEVSLQQLTEFVAVAVMIFSFLFGAQFGHTR